MAWSVVLGVSAALSTGFFVGLWAAFVGAPPEVAGGIASVLGGGLGFAAFGAAIVVRLMRRTAARAILRARFA